MWIPIDERVPDDDRQVLVSFENHEHVAIGRYVVEPDTGSGRFENSSCYPFNRFDLFVNAWMELPERYEG